jgi:hypothetical protein
MPVCVWDNSIKRTNGCLAFFIAIQTAKAMAVFAKHNDSFAVCFNDVWLCILVFVLVLLRKALQLVRRSVPMESNYRGVLAMVKIRITRPAQTCWLGYHEFHDDEIELAGAFCEIDTPNYFEYLDDVFTFELYEIVASMWTFDQGMLTGDIFNSRLAKFDLQKVWHAKYLLEKVGEVDRKGFCRTVHILHRLMN